jgi:hypothetical protein
VKRQVPEFQISSILRSFIELNVFRYPSVVKIAGSGKPNYNRSSGGIVRLQRYCGYLQSLYF